MSNKQIAIILGVFVVLIGALIALTAVLTPENTKPAFNAAVDFINAAGTYDEQTAFALLSPGMQNYVRENCPDGRVSACIAAYTPPEWGELLKYGSAVYRRSIRDGNAWDIQILATYEEGQGFAGVCIYHRVEEVTPGDWRITAWSGFISCDDPHAGLQALRQPDAPNYVRGE
ncbi:MAG: hypothetical protein CUN56_06835 [Phototrophicales bacterium]|nr:MAG: hypothetical protein CUN56_06835 [Phototrophicales bacterium]RMG71474.1 MAG: hypothetical protein D6711_15280 [Chloroflexota bacterium]